MDPGVRLLDDDTVLVGGSPLRILRLTRRGADIVAAWRGGRRCEGPTELTLARHLLDGGLVHPRPVPGAAGPGDVTVVVPVRDRADALARCLAALGPCDRVLVVDDASRDPDRIAAAAAAHGARVIRRGTSGGPAAARNAGLAHASTPYVAFVDSDCRPEPGWLETLLPHFQDPAVAALAPRVVPADGTGWIDRYDSCRSSLDLGPAEAPVVPRSRVAYVPAAALVVRRSAVGSGFDVARTVGEDVDLVWRLWEAGWTVRYVPSARVVHDPRRTVAGWAARRFAYGTSAAPLAAAHPGQVPPVVLSGWSLTAWALALAGRPDAALGVVAAASGLMARRLPLREGRMAEGARLAGLGTLAVGEALAATVTQVWWPVAVPAALVSRRARRAVVAAALARPALVWLRNRPQSDPLRFGAACLLDDLVYGAGVWWGCLREGTVEPLLPQLMGRIPVTRRPAD
ncbi:MAG: mycofactocin system glycosyltransferase [Streptosporangiales bacterium]|nr:mycofactocin system glycosyltransferase [Streptosporangiales bacterium]